MPQIALAQCGLARCAQSVHIHEIVNAGLEPAVISGRIFRLETAITSDELARGLMQRDHLDADAGMIFIYPREQLLSFWMANCLIDLDILYLDSRGRIVSMYTMNAEPLRDNNESEARYEARLERYPSGRLAQYAVELQAGMIKTMKLKLGDRVHVDFDRLVRAAK